MPTSRNSASGPRVGASGRPPVGLASRGGRARRASARPPSRARPSTTATKDGCPPACSIRVCCRRDSVSCLRRCCPTRARGLGEQSMRATRGQSQNTRLRQNGSPRCSFRRAPRQTDSGYRFRTIRRGGDRARPAMLPRDTREPAFSASVEPAAGEIPDGASTRLPLGRGRELAPGGRRNATFRAFTQNLHHGPRRLGSGQPGGLYWAWPTARPDPLEGHRPVLWSSCHRRGGGF